jgi:tRNA (adenine37-N6)-methyltransferase
MAEGGRSPLAADHHSFLLLKKNERAALLSPSEFSLLLHQTRKRQVETMTLGSKNTTNTSLTWMAIAVVTSSAATALATAAMGYWYYQQKSRKVELQWEQKRQEERTGRIRAEVKLRKALLQVTNQSRNETNHKSQARKKTIQDVVYDQHAIKISCIGIVQSPYTKRMGTPRQGALVPHSRAIVQFSHDISPELLDGIMEYSHVWIIFAFHDNTNLADSRKTKIRPPRGNGQKVGQLATRSPHRPNPLGLSVVQVESFHPSKRQLHIRGLDLVNGTPVYDIKPYVHWDIVGVDSGADEAMIHSGVPLKIPDWVERRDDVLAQVEFAPSTLVSLQQLVGRENALAPLYPAKDPTSVLAVQQTLFEILAQDPRSSHKGVTKNQRGTTTSSSNKSHQSHGKNIDNNEEAYRLLFGPTVVEFVVRDDGAHVIHMSMAEPTTKTTDSTNSTGSPLLINGNEKDGEVDEG